MLKSNAQCEGIWRWGLWGVIRINVLIREAPRVPSPLPPWEDTVRRWPSMNQRVGPHQTPNLLMPWTMRSKYFLCIRHPVFWYLCYSSLNREDNTILVAIISQEQWPFGSPCTCFNWHLITTTGNRFISCLFPACQKIQASRFPLASGSALCSSPKAWPSSSRNCMFEWWYHSRTTPCTLSVRLHLEEGTHTSNLNKKTLT